MFEITLLGVVIISTIYLFGKGVWLVGKGIFNKGNEEQISRGMKFLLGFFLFSAIASYFTSNGVPNVPIFISLLKLALILVLIIVLHELGHMIAGNFFKIHTDEFCIGIGPILYKKSYKNTNYILRALPIKGHVKQDVEKVRNLPLVSQIIIYLAGIFINLGCFIIGMAIYLSQQGMSFIAGIIAISAKVPEIFHQAYLVIVNMQVNDIFTPTHNLENTVELAFSLSPLLNDFWFTFASINIILALLNLIPIPILDGGRVVLAVMESLLKLLKVPQKWVNKFFYTILTLGFLMYLTPTVVNNFWSHSIRIGFEPLEYLLWMLLGVSIIMNISIYFENRKGNGRPLQK
ncbi:site-2 protease family protein [Priestia filamentosa]|uniref:site-2 protease family protein n=1 Tax=Priestia filamentosa TaxID=1402861 RepID=UPI000588EA90